MTSDGTATPLAQPLQAYLDRCERGYDPSVHLLSLDCSNPGYHSQLKSGQRVHPTRESLQYALALFCGGGSQCVQRACDVLRKVLSLQDTDSFSNTYGIWSWYLEEPIEQMRPPDWNWADFLGARLAQILHDHSAALPPDLLREVRQALGHAAWSIFRRNVSLLYTNIAVMGAGVTAVAGEFLGEERLLDFGRQRLMRVLELVDYHGTFTEYNSPTYTMVVLTECERILHLSSDTAVRQAAQNLRQAAWQVIAEHFHPATGQWAGPQSRAYDNHISASLAAYLSAQTGAQIRPHPRVMASADRAVPSLIPPLPCPPQWADRFSRLPQCPVQIRKRFICREGADAPPAHHSSQRSLLLRQQPQEGDKYGDRCGTTWFSHDATLGSINHENLWTQRRALLGYWRTAEDPAVCLRLRFLHDGRDFASAFVRNQQLGPRVLSAMTLLTQRGDWHPFFDRPVNDLFEAEDFRLRYELTGQSVRVESMPAGQFALIAGDHRAVISTAPGKFGSLDVQWKLNQETGLVSVDAICYHGPRTGFHPATMGPVFLASALELIGPGQTPTLQPLSMTRLDDFTYRAKWADLELIVPARAGLYPE